MTCDLWPYNGLWPVNCVLQLLTHDCNLWLLACDLWLYMTYNETCDVWLVTCGLWLKYSSTEKKDLLEKPLPEPRSGGTIQVSFTPREFKTAARESKAPEEEEVLCYKPSMLYCNCQDQVHLSVGVNNHRQNLLRHLWKMRCFLINHFITDSQPPPNQ